MCARWAVSRPRRSKASTDLATVHVPILRNGRAYASLDTLTVTDPRTGEPCATVSQANAGLIRRDLRAMAEARRELRGFSCARLLDICAEAGELFLNSPLPCGMDNEPQSAQDYVEVLSTTSGLPHVLCRQNMHKIHTALTQMPTILRGLMRGLDLNVLDEGVGRQAEVDVCYAATTDALGVVLPSNSPGVNSIWLPAVALKVPVLLKPGREEPWTPMRIVQALIAAGYPPAALGYYPTDHAGTEVILNGCGRSIFFGDDATLRRFAANPHIQLHGSGRSKVLLGEDVIHRWPELLDVLVASILDNGGRSCINASCIIVPRCGDEIAEALAQRLAAVEPRPPADPDAQLAALVNPQYAEYVDTTIEQALGLGAGATDVTARFRHGSRKVTLDGLTYLCPTIIRCDSFEHPLANTEFLFAFASVVEMPLEDAVRRIGPTLAATVITDDAGVIDRFLNCPHVDRLNLGPLATSCVDWAQPHEGNLFEFLYRRRALQQQGV